MDMKNIQELTLKQLTQEQKKFLMTTIEKFNLSVEQKDRIALRLMFEWNIKNSLTNLDNLY